MKRLLFGLIFLALTGCTVTGSAYVEKDWSFNRNYSQPDLRSRAQIEWSR